jgi:ribosome-binding protein aMBF1 (putative translation factor)
MQCDGCGELTLTMNELQEYERAAAAAVLCTMVPGSGAMVRYARRALGLSKEGLADAIYCNSIDVITRWEDGQEAIDLCSQMAIVALLMPSEVG